VRTFGDVVFIVGAVAVSWQVVRGLAAGRSGHAAPGILQPARQGAAQ
jgi:nitric oxide reductase subunit B